jgi:hypothetical protein
MNEDVNAITTPFSGEFGADVETAKRLIAAYPNVDIRRLMSIAGDPRQPQSSRIASIYTLGFTDDHGISKSTLAGLASDPHESHDIRDYAAEALASITPRH